MPNQRYLTFKLILFFTKFSRTKHIIHTNIVCFYRFYRMLTSGEIQSVASDKISHSRVC